MEAREVRKAAAELRAMWVLGNEYLQSAAPWSTFKTDPAQAAMQVGRTGSPEQVQQAVDIIDEARRRLYAILAEA